MRTLKQILTENIVYVNDEWVISYIITDVKEWLQQKRTKYPRLNNYPDYATKIELIEYVDILTDWASDREEYTELLEELDIES